MIHLSIAIVNDSEAMDYPLGVVKNRLKLQKASTHKSATTHACTVFVT